MINTKRSKKRGGICDSLETVSNYEFKVINFDSDIIKTKRGASFTV